MTPGRYKREDADEQELIDGVLAGRRDDYADLVRRHYPRILGLCVSMLGDASEAEDAAQETFLKAYRSLADFEGKSSFGTWLHRIASNRCLDALRRRTRRGEESLDALLETEGPRVRRLVAEPARGGDPSGDADLVRRVLDRLTPEHRLILTLRELQGLDYKELMEALDCSMDAVKSRLRRARAAFLMLARHISGSSGV